MAIFAPATSSAVTNTPAVEIYTPTTGGVQQNPTIINVGANTLYIGSSGVTSSTGLPLLAGCQLTLTGTEEAIYAICASGKTSTALTGLATVDSVV